MPNTWTPTDFVLFGKLCDDYTLSQQLEKIRTALDADTTILLVSHGTQFFRSMIYVADKNKSRGDALQKELILRCNAGWQEQTRKLPSQEKHGPLMTMRDEFPQDAFFNVLSKRIIGPIHVATFPEHPAAHAMPVKLPTDEAPPSFMIVAVNPADLEGAVLREFEAARQPLACMVNASQAVRAHCWNQSIREVDRLLEECESQWEAELEKAASGSTARQDNEFERVLKFGGDLLVNLATKLTHSSIGQVFVAKSTTPFGLRPLAWKKYPCDEMGGIVSLAYDRVRAVLINDIQGFLRTHPRIEYKRPKGAYKESRAELAVPITQNTAGDNQGVIGVLNVEKEEDDPGQYTTRDLDICQHLARRFGRWQARMQHAIFARSLAQLTRKVALSPGSALRDPVPGQGNNGQGRSNSHSRTTGHMRCVDGEWHDDRVPSEFRQAFRPVEEELKTVFELTRSHMVRVFLVSADGRALVPFCDFPKVKGIHDIEPSEPADLPTRIDKPTAYDVGLDRTGSPIRLPVIRLEPHSRSISAWVARHGIPCFIGDFDLPDALKEYEGLDSYLRTYDETRSECCVPLFISGRLVGTLNFQSYYVNVYREQRHLIEAIAELIGLTFDRVRRAVEQDLFESRAVLAYYTHELIHKVDDLEKLADQHSAPIEFCDKIAILKSMLEHGNFPILLGEGRTDGNRSSSRPIAAIVREQFKRVKRKDFEFRPDLDAEFFGYEVPGDAVFPLGFALHEVLQNSTHEAALVKGGRVEIECRKRCLGGQTYAVFIVMNPCSSKEPDSYKHELYRQPYRTEQNERMHLGAYIAGSMLRAVGGELSFEFGPAPSGPGFMASTRIEVKVQLRVTNA